MEELYHNMGRNGGIGGRLKLVQTDNSSPLHQQTSHVYETCEVCRGLTNSKGLCPPHFFSGMLRVDP